MAQLKSETSLNGTRVGQCHAKDAPWYHTNEGFLISRLQSNDPMPVAVPWELRFTYLVRLGAMSIRSDGHSAKSRNALSCD